MIPLAVVEVRVDPFDLCFDFVTPLVLRGRGRICFNFVSTRKSNDMANKEPNKKLMDSGFSNWTAEQLPDLTAKRLWDESVKFVGHQWA